MFVRAIAVIAWVTSLSIVGLVPVDVLDSLQGTSGSITGPLGILWSISYWCVLTTALQQIPASGYLCLSTYSWLQDNTSSMLGSGAGHYGVC